MFSLLRPARRCPVTPFVSPPKGLPIHIASPATTPIVQMLLAPAHKRRLLLFLAISMDFVPRLWFSMLQPCR